MPIEAFDQHAPDAVFAFLDERLGGRGRAHWKWKYRVGRDEAPSAFYWIASDGAVLGFIGLMRTTLHGAGGSSWPAAWFVDWQVTPGERGVGVGVGLLRKAEQAAGMLMTLQGSADTRAVLPRLGWKETTRPATWMRPLSGRWVGAWAKHRGLHGLASPLATLASPVLALLAKKDPTPRRVRTVDVEHLPEAHDSAWAKCRDSLAPLMTRDRAWFDWFCSDYPGSRYRVALLEEDGVAKGHLITRVDRDRSGLKRGRIVDLLWPAGDAPGLAEALSLACRRLAGDGADYVQCLSSRDDFDAALARLRFQKRSNVPIWYHRLGASAPPPDDWMVSLVDCDRAWR